VRVCFRKGCVRTARKLSGPPLPLFQKGSLSPDRVPHRAALRGVALAMLAFSDLAGPHGPLPLSHLAMLLHAIPFYRSESGSSMESGTGGFTGLARLFLHFRRWPSDTSSRALSYLLPSWFSLPQRGETRTVPPPGLLPSADPGGGGTKPGHNFPIFLFFFLPFVLGPLICRSDRCL